MASTRLTKYSFLSSGQSRQITKSQSNHLKIEARMTTKATHQAIEYSYATKPLDRSWVAFNGICTHENPFPNDTSKIDAMW